jgi:hypothetical protein
LRELYETILQFAGMEQAPFQHGGIQRFWRQDYQPLDSDGFVVSEVSGGTADPGPISLTTPEWQYIDNSLGGEELYNWVSDPGEKINLAKSPDALKTLKDLQSQLRVAETESLRPWFGPQYLPVMAPPDAATGKTSWLPVQLDLHALQSGRIPIGVSQAFFPRRESKLNQPPSESRELLRSLPYH